MNKDVGMLCLKIIQKQEILAVMPKPSIDRKSYGLLKCLHGGKQKENQYMYHKNIQYSEYFVTNI